MKLYEYIQFYVVIHITKNRKQKSYIVFNPDKSVDVNFILNIC
jgi:hypothetical protein